MVIAAIIGFGFFSSKDKTITNHRSDTPIEYTAVYGPSLNGYTPTTLAESFETAPFPPAGWVKYKAGTATDSGWFRAPVGLTPLPGWTGGVITAPTGGGNYVAFVAYNVNVPSNREYLVTPQLLNIQPNDSLYFWRRFWPTDTYSDTLSIKISTTTNAISSFTIQVARIPFPRNSTDTNWTRHGYRLGNFVTTGANIYIAFIEHVLDNFNDGATVSLDLVQVTYNAVGIGKQENGIPKEFGLEQNYPNPFNPSTMLKFSLPKAGNIKLTVYDMLGKEVEVVLDEFKQAGTYSVMFDGSYLPSGVYFYTLTSQDQKDTERMVLVK